MSEFDIIIVGAGSAGSIVANRLSQNRNLKILILLAFQFCSGMATERALKKKLFLLV